MCRSLSIKRLTSTVILISSLTVLETPRFYCSLIKIFQAMLGVVKRISKEGLFVLVNERSYSTDLKFISFGVLDSIPDLIPRSKISYVGKTLELTEYLDCDRCQKPVSLEGTHECDCKPQNIVSVIGELIKMESKLYNSGEGLKVSLKCDEKLLHSVLFHGNAMVDILKEFEIGEMVNFKAIIINSGDVHDLVKIFYVKNFK